MESSDRIARLVAAFGVQQVLSSESSKIVSARIDVHPFVVDPPAQSRDGGQGRELAKAWHRALKFVGDLLQQEVAEGDASQAGLAVGD